VLRRLSGLNRERWQAEPDRASPTLARAAEPPAERIARTRPQLQLVAPSEQPDLFGRG
jgi:hypothetical protein